MNIIFPNPENKFIRDFKNGILMGTQFHEQKKQNN